MALLNRISMWRNSHKCKTPKTWALLSKMNLSPSLTGPCPPGEAIPQQRRLWAAYRENALPVASLFPPSSPGKRTCLIERSLFILGSQVSKKGRRGGREERREEEKTQRNKEQERNNDRQIQRIGSDAWFWMLNVNPLRGWWKADFTHVIPLTRTVP